MKRVLISLYDKTGILDFAGFLKEKGVEILSTGGTFRHLKEAGFDPVEVSDYTGFPEMMDGRVKTLHPKIHGGILGVRANPEHVSVMGVHGILPIDMVIVNLYPFFNEVVTDKTFDEKIEFIDIGGPTMLRSAAKNFKDVVVIHDPADYAVVQKQMEDGEVTYETRKRLAGKVFNLTNAYDAAISQFLLDDNPTPAYFSASYKKVADLRYGENAHQKAAYYVSTLGQGALADFKQLGGKELSFNNIRDMDVAWKIVNEFDTLACCGLKHSTPCGVALGETPFDAYKKAYECDPVSIFGGIVSLNGEVDKAMAEELVKTFLEIIIAVSFSKEALGVLQAKKNLRIIEAGAVPSDPVDIVKVDGGLLVQEADLGFSTDFKVVTKAKPTPEDMKALIFGQKVVKHTKSNAIVAVKDNAATGIGNGQTNRIWAAEQALDRAGDATVLASDAFFPFDDVVKLCARKGIRAIIQPGGSIRDEDSISACDKHGIAMVITGMRHFKH